MSDHPVPSEPPEGHVPRPLTAEEERRFRANLDGIEALMGDDDYSLQWSNYTCRRLLATLDAARSASPDQPEPLDVDRLDRTFTEMAQRGWLNLPDGHGPSVIRDVFIEAYGRVSETR